jgi:hypothetical protein
MKIKFYINFIILSLSILCCKFNQKTYLLYDDYKNLRSGPLASDFGARTEYHYFSEASPKGNWAVSSYRYNVPIAWFIRKINNKKYIFHNAINTDNFWHPIIICGNEYWNNYSINNSLIPLVKHKQIGIVFYYQNDRQYYFFGIINDSAILKLVNHEKSFHVQNEKILAKKLFHYKINDTINLSISIKNSIIKAKIFGGPEFIIEDSTYKRGKAGFLSDGITAFGPIEIFTSKNQKKIIEDKIEEIAEIEKNLQLKNTQMVLWKKIKTNNYGTGRNIRFGYLNNDTVLDILLGQVINHGPKDRNSELSCLTAIDVEGNILWQTGKPDPWKNILTSDVAFQIHDINNDSKNEVIYCMNQELVIAESETGKIIKKISTPLSPENSSKEYNIYKHILGDCIFFCNVSGKEYDSDILIKDRYSHFWVYNNKLQLLWDRSCKTGHYPFAYDIDNDKKDEILIGYSLFDDNGNKLWSNDSIIEDHADGVAIVKLNDNEDPKIICSASDEGMIIMSLNGKILKHHYIGHVQNPAIANFRDDLPGLEIVTVNFWGNQGIINLYDSKGNIYYTFEPNQYGSMCLPLNWTGKTEEYFILNASVEEGGIYNGWGRKVLIFPDDGHPDMCYSVANFTGDCRDEIVVWNNSEIWIYTQSDNPKQGKLYNPVRNKLYNSSNYQASVSLP